MSDNNNNSSPDALKAEELSRRYYYGGWIGLPWLWIVHTLYWYGKQRELHHDDDEAANAAAYETDGQEQSAKNERMWVKRGQASAIFVTLAWIAWILIIQVFLTDKFPSSWFVREPDASGESTGW